jgi:hypothetical protein
LVELLPGADTRQRALLAEWQAHAQQLRQRYGLA